MPQDKGQKDNSTTVKDSKMEADKIESTKLEEKAADTSENLAALEEDDEFEDFPAEGKPNFYKSLISRIAFCKSLFSSTKYFMCTKSSN